MGFGVVIAGVFGAAPVGATGADAASWTLRLSVLEQWRTSAWTGRAAPAVSTAGAFLPRAGDGGDGERDDERNVFVGHSTSGSEMRQVVLRTPISGETAFRGGGESSDYV